MASPLYIYQRIVRAKLFIDAHYSEGINLDDIAGGAYFSKFHFIRLFKTIYGNTPHQYLMKIRIEQAKLLLQKGLPMSQVCINVGFESITSFTALFRRYNKVSPAAYQKQCMQRQEQIRQSPLRFIPNCFAERKGWV